jgi:hypothetical protein
MPVHKLTRDDYEEARALHARGFSCQEIADLFAVRGRPRVTQEAIRRVVRGIIKKAGGYNTPKYSALPGFRPSETVRKGTETDSLAASTTSNPQGLTS